MSQHWHVYVNGESLSVVPLDKTEAMAVFAHLADTMPGASIEIRDPVRAYDEERALTLSRDPEYQRMMRPVPQYQPPEQRVQRMLDQIMP